MSIGLGLVLPNNEHMDFHLALFTYVHTYSIEILEREINIKFYLPAGLQLESAINA